MSGNYYWEDRLSSLVKDTETNLNKAKHHLGSLRKTEPAVYRPRSPAYSPTHLGMGSNFSSPAVEYDQLTRLPGLEHSGGGGGLDQSWLRRHQDPVNPALAQIISEKLEKQSSMIEGLCRQVKLLSSQQEEGQKRVRLLEGELEVVRTRLHEAGVNLQTEHKFSQFKQEMRSEIFDLHSKMRQQRVHDGGGMSLMPGPSPLDLADSKIFHEELRMLRRDMEALKTKQIKQESQHYIHRSQKDRIDEERLKNLEMQDLQKQVASIRQDINTLIENRLQTPPREKKRSGSKLRPSGDFLLMTDSDLSSLSDSGGAPSKDISDINSLDFSDHLSEKAYIDSEDDGDFL